MTAAEIFAAHATKCAPCSSGVIERPATLANACWEGSRLFKDAAATIRRDLERQAEKLKQPRVGHGEEGLE